MKSKIVNKPVGTVSIYLIDKETKMVSKSVPIEDVIYNQYGIEFEFGEPEDEGYVTLPYNDFLFYSEDYTTVVKIDGDKLMEV